MSAGAAEGKEDEQGKHVARSQKPEAAKGESASGEPIPKHTVKQTDATASRAARKAEKESPHSEEQEHAPSADCRRCACSPSCCCSRALQRETRLAFSAPNRGRDDGVSMEHGSRTTSAHTEQATSNNGQSPAPAAQNKPHRGKRVSIRVTEGVNSGEESGCAYRCRRSP